MRLALLFLALGAMPAWALEHPQPIAGGEPHICSVPYKENDMVELTALAGEAITVVFASDEVLGYYNGSDTKHLAYATAGPAGNVIYFKANNLIPPVPVEIRTIRTATGKPRDYQFQWTTTSTIFSPPPAQKPAQVASNGATAAAEVIATPVQPTECWKVVFTYAADVKAATAAKWTAAAAKRKQDDVEADLERNGGMACINYRYVGQGDAALKPASVCNDGKGSEGSTLLTFAGAVPVALGVAPDGKDTQLSGFNWLDHGRLKIHSIPPVYRDKSGHALPVIRLRSDGQVYCIYDVNGSSGQNTDTGTTDPGISREIAR